jgi:hypothetical protein
LEFRDFEYRMEHLIVACLGRHDGINELQKVEVPERCIIWPYAIRKARALMEIYEKLASG